MTRRNLTARGYRLQVAYSILRGLGTVGYFAYAESVTGLREEKNEFSYCFFALRVGSEGVAKMIGFK
jgi:hypothetical protein